MLSKIIFGIDILSGLTGLILLGSLVWSHFERHSGPALYTTANAILMMCGALSVILAIFWALYFLVAYFNSTITTSFTAGLAIFLIAISIAVIIIVFFKSGIFN